MVQKQILTTTKQWVASNYKQRHGIYHCCWCQVIPVFKQPDLSPSVDFFPHTQLWTGCCSSHSNCRDALNLRSGHHLGQAINTVWHLALLAKLSACGVEGNLDSWICDFLHTLGTPRNPCSCITPKLVTHPFASCTYSDSLWLTLTGLTSFPVPLKDLDPLRLILEHRITLWT